MTVTSIDKDPEALTMTIFAEFAAPVSSVWQMWDDPRRLERWWGPPTHPATVVHHDLQPEGRVSYFMTSPEGDRHFGWWKVTAIDPPSRLEFVDGFADDSGEPNQDMPTTNIRVTLDAEGEGTRMAIRTTFPSLETMEQMVAMGMEEGMTLALGQIDEILSEDVRAV
jgi:uncharacterized protein YndB with AHSA1/START domain